MRVGSLFSGYDGLGMGFQALFPQARTAWFVEFDKAPSKVLAHHWPEVPNLGDITQIDWSRVAPIDILTGGFPCQDVSHAGLRKGIEPGTRSGLWEHFAYAIDRLQPKVVIIENVRGLLSARTGDSQEVVRVGPKGGRKVELTRRALGRVLWDLADIGYDAQWVSVRASDVGAPHGRFRVFITAQPTAYADQQGLEGRPALRQRADEHAAGQGGVGHVGESLIDFGVYGPAVARWEAILGRPAPSPTRPGRDGRPRLNPVFVEWMMGLPAGHVTDPAIGLTRSEMLKILGNGVVPAQASTALSHMIFGTPIAGGAAPVLTLRTPTAQLAINGGSQHPDKRKAGGHGPTLADEVEHLLPTPAVNDMGEGKSVEDWDAWTERMKAEHRNGNGHGKSLSIEAQRIVAGQE